MLKKMLYDEFAFVLEIKPDEVIDFIASKLNEWLIKEGATAVLQC